MIRIPESTFSRLQELATPFTDTPATVIDRLLEFWHQEHEDNAPAPEPASNKTRGGGFSAMNPPDLHHSRLRSAVIGKIAVKTWNELVAAAHEEALASGCDYDELRKISLSNLRKGEFSGNGFKPHPALGLSIQNVDSNNAWRHAFHIAKRFGFPIRADFEWRNKEAAAFPGEQGFIEWAPGSDDSDSK